MENEKEQNEIWILSPDLTLDDDESVRGTDLEESVIKRLNPEKFKKGIESFTSMIGESIDSFGGKLENFQLDEITVKIDITAEGQVLFLGTGGKASGTGGIQLKFNRISK
ncbi:MAG: hypothetical protein RLO12_05220 [Fulvivirga sp.]|uniref:Pepco domain-containing protein n=1 Tax=Marinoscillum sp. TaxID=2024838 RepID=UPI0032F9B42F